jgi:hypothetical protein
MTVRLISSLRLKKSLSLSSSPSCVTWSRAIDRAAVAVWVWWSEWLVLRRNEMSWAGIQKKIQIENSGERRKIEFVPSKKTPPSSFSAPSPDGGNRKGNPQDIKSIKNKEKKNEIYSLDSVNQSMKWKSIRR